SKWGASTDDQSWHIALTGDAEIQLKLWSTGPPGGEPFTFDEAGAGFDEGYFDGPMLYTFTSNALASPPARLYVRVKFTADTGADSRKAEFFTSSSFDGPWPSIGEDEQDFSVTLQVGDEPVRVGSDGPGEMDHFNGTITRVQLRNENDEVVADPNFDEQPHGTLEFTDSVGRAWTIEGNVQIGTDTPVFVIGYHALNSHKVLTY